MQIKYIYYIIYTPLLFHLTESKARVFLYFISFRFILCKYKYRQVMWLVCLFVFLFHFIFIIMLTNISLLQIKRNEKFQLSGVHIFLSNIIMCVCEELKFVHIIIKYLLLLRFVLFCVGYFLSPLIFVLLIFILQLLLLCYFHLLHDFSHCLLVIDVYIFDSRLIWYNNRLQ